MEIGGLKSKRLQLPIDIQIELFDKTILPILLYGSEVWGFDNIDILEMFYRKFLRNLLQVNKFTPDAMIFGETGCSNIASKIKSRILNYCIRLYNGRQSKISVLLYKLCKYMHDDPESDYKCKWIDYIRTSLDGAGFNDIWSILDFNILYLKIGLRMFLTSAYMICSSKIG